MDTSKPPFEGGGFGNSVIDNFPECAFLVVSRSERTVPPIFPLHILCPTAALEGCKQIAILPSDPRVKGGKEQHLVLISNEI